MPDIAESNYAALLPPVYADTVVHMEPDRDSGRQAAAEPHHHVLNPRTLLGAMNPKNLAILLAGTTVGGGLGYALGRQRDPSGQATDLSTPSLCLTPTRTLRPGGDGYLAPTVRQALAAANQRRLGGPTLGADSMRGADRRVGSLVGAGGVLPSIWSNVEIHGDAPSDVDMTGKGLLANPRKKSGSKPRQG